MCTQGTELTPTYSLWSFEGLERAFHVLTYTQLRPTPEYVAISVLRCARLETEMLVEVPERNSAESHLFIGK